MAGFQFQDTTAIKRVFQQPKKRIRAVSGGTSACKTIGILVWLIDYAQSVKNEIITVVAESVPHLKLGAIRDFQSIMQSQGYWKENQWNESNHIYTFETGTFIEFISFDKFGKAHGPRRDVLFINEANNLPYNIVDQLITRTRKIVWMDWNPVEDFWFYEEILGKREDVDFLGDGGNFPPLTFIENEGLDEESRKEIEAHRNNKSWWKVYGEGKRGELEGRIFKNWIVIDDIPKEARLVRRWLDFGYTNDPTSIGDVYEYNGGYLLDEIAYQKGLLNKDIADIIKLQPLHPIVIADSAEPKSIDELKLYGITVLPSSKGQGSVNRDIAFVQQQIIYVTRHSFNTLKEYRNYLFLVDKDGKILNEEDPKCANHSMAGIRYAIGSLKPQETEIIRKQEQHFIHNKFNRQLNSTK